MKLWMTMPMWYIYRERALPCIASIYNNIANATHKDKIISDVLRKNIWDDLTVGHNLYDIFLDRRIQW